MKRGWQVFHNKYQSQHEDWQFRVLRHACSTPLSALNLVYALSQQTSSVKDLKRLFAQAKQATDRLEQLIIHHRLRSERVVKVNLNQTLLSVASLFERPDVRIEVVCLHSRPVYFRCAPTQFEEVMICLLSNALAAYDKKHQKHILVAIKKVVNRVLVVITDVGVGMRLSWWQKPRSTKANGGMGLAFAREIIEKHLNGEFSIKSEPWIGTRVVISLPLAR